MNSRVWQITFVLGICTIEIWAANPPAYLPSVNDPCPVLPACCTGPKATISFRELQFWQTSTPGDAIFLSSSDPCDFPRATCTVPQASRVELVSYVSAAEDSTDLPRSVEQILQIWEQHVRRDQPISDRERRWIERMSPPSVNAHALAMALPLLGPVMAQHLQEQFAWDFVSQTSERIELRAVPRDETQRLFCSAVNVTLQRNSYRVSRMEVADKSGEWSPVLLPTSFEKGDLSAAHLVLNELPPSPAPVPSSADKPLIRFAAGIIEIEESPR